MSGSVLGSQYKTNKGDEGTAHIVLVSAGIELTVFLVAGTVLCFEFSM